VGALGAARADAIVNCTAYNAVDAAESHTAEAMAVNAEAVRALADAADAAGAALVHFSTDFVFDGDAEQPYTEYDEPRPISAYGRSKLEGERWAGGARRGYVLRLASVFGGRPGQGAGGSTTIDRIIDQLSAGREVAAFADRTVSPSYTHDVAAAVRALLTRDVPGLYHCVNSGWTTWAELASHVASTLGIPARVRPISMSDVQLVARRPLRCALSNARLAALGIAMPTWRDALARHIVARQAAAAGVVADGLQTVPGTG
jgi:dTDP-4-dehydrorhamnose reductase